jgi:hypothetical protein
MSRTGLVRENAGMATRRKTRKPKAAKVQLIASESKVPTIIARAGTKIEVVALSTPEGKPARIGARLCGYGSGYCLAIIDTE